MKGFPMSHYKIKLKNLSLDSIAGVFCAIFILSACGASDPVASNNTRRDIFTKIDEQQPTNQAEFESTFETSEYKKSTVLSMVKASYGYYNIGLLTSSDIKQAGEAGIVSVVIQSDSATPAKNLFATAHPEFGTNGAAFNSIYNASGNSGKGT